MVSRFDLMSYEEKSKLKKAMKRGEVKITEHSVGVIEDSFLPDTQVVTQPAPAKKKRAKKEKAPEDPAPAEVAKPPAPPAVLRASNADIWMNCPGAYHLWQMVKLAPEEKDEAGEGTLAHSVFAELNLAFVEQRNPNMARLAEIRKDGALSEVAFLEMMNLAQGASNRAMELIARANVKGGNISNLRAAIKDVTFFIEEELKIAHNVPGHADLAAVTADETEGFVVDYKYGIGKEVNAETAMQLIFYAVALFIMYPTLRKVTLYIDQPRSATGAQRSEHVLRRGQLRAWTKFMEDQIKLIRRGTAELNIGPWCGFCPAHSECPKHIEGAEPLLVQISYKKGSKEEREQFLQDLPHRLTREQKAFIFHNRTYIVKCLEAVCESMRQSALHGDDYTDLGLELRHGRGARFFDFFRFGGEEGFVKHLMETHDLKREQLYSAPELIGLGKLEELIGEPAVDALTQKGEAKSSLKPIKGFVQLRTPFESKAIEQGESGDQENANAVFSAGADIAESDGSEFGEIES